LKLSCKCVGTSENSVVSWKLFCTGVRTVLRKIGRYVDSRRCCSFYAGTKGSSAIAQRPDTIFWVRNPSPRRVTYSGFPQPIDLASLRFWFSGASCMAASRHGRLRLMLRCNSLAQIAGMAAARKASRHQNP
jgi:hypothetical protein